MSELVKIDGLGRILIPKKLREALGLVKDVRLILEKKDDSLMLTPVHKASGDAVTRLAAMNLPVKEWRKIEEEIEKGAVSD